MRITKKQMASLLEKFPKEEVEKMIENSRKCKASVRLRLRYWKKNGVVPGAFVILKKVPYYVVEKDPNFSVMEKLVGKPVEVSKVNPNGSLVLRHDSIHALYKDNDKDVHRRDEFEVYYDFGHVGLIGKKEYKNVRG